MRHYDGAMRKFFAQKLAQIALPVGPEASPQVISPKALDAIERALQHPDERVQRAATDAISSYHPWFSIGTPRSPTRCLL